MQQIDFLSLPPSNKLSIFNQRKNKTRFGGSIFLIEIIAIILIIFIYLFDHFKTSTYVIESNEIFQTYKDAMHSLETDKRFDPMTYFTFNIFTDYGNEVSDKFIVSTIESEFSPNPTVNLRETGITERPSKLKVSIFFKCYNKTLCKYFPRGTSDTDYTLEYYKLQINYPGYEIRHQHKIPLRKAGHISIKCPFLFDTVTRTKFQWRNIKYEEESGMWSRFFNNYLLGKEPVSYVEGHIESYTTYPVERDKDKIITLDKQYQYLATIEIENDIYRYLNYKRTENSIFTTIANISALISTVNFILIQFLSFYSYNFDNYQIINYISKKGNISIKDLTKNLEKKAELKDINEKGETNEPLIYEEKEMFNEDIGSVIQNKMDKKHESINFLQFFLNYFYCSCCKKRKEQEIIKICNEIISKYLSIESLLYNQIILESFWNDYRWNDPDLNNLKKNDLIIKFNNLV